MILWFDLVGLLLDDVSTSLQQANGWESHVYVFVYFMMYIVLTQIITSTEKKY